MTAAEQEALERTIKAHFDAGALSAAATVAIRGYGPQLFGLLRSLHQDEQEAADVFSTFTEDLWRGLPQFQWNCSFRTWAYTLVRNASFRHKKQARRRALRDVPLSDAHGLSQVAAQVRTETAPHLRSGTRDQFALLRQELSKEDQLLLILRVDKQLSWDDLVRVMSGGEVSSPEEQKRVSARLRKRFQLLKEHLLAEVKKRGLGPFASRETKG